MRYGPAMCGVEVWSKAGWTKRGTAMIAAYVELPNGASLMVDITVDHAKEREDIRQWQGSIIEAFNATALRNEDPGLAGRPRFRAGALNWKQTRRGSRKEFARQQPQTTKPQAIAFPTADFICLTGTW